MVVKLKLRTYMSIGRGYCGSLNSPKIKKAFPSGFLSSVVNSKIH